MRLPPTGFGAHTILRRPRSPPTPPGGTECVRSSCASVKALAQLAPADRLRVSCAVVRHSPLYFSCPGIFHVFVACFLLKTIEQERRQLCAVIFRQCYRLSEKILDN